MRTAATPTDDSLPLDFYWVPDGPISQYYIYLHFAEIVMLNASQLRSFNVTIDGNDWYRSLVPSYLSTVTLYSASVLPRGEYQFSIIKTQSSTLPPIINAVEIYSVKNLSQSATDQEDGMYVLFYTCFSNIISILIYIEF